jgi:hypothetical protein
VQNELNFRSRSEFRSFFLHISSIFMILEILYQIEFYGDFDGSFHKSLDLEIDLSAALLGRRSHRSVEVNSLLF